MKNKQIALLRQYKLAAMDQYFEMIIDSKVNGQNAQVESQFNALPQDDKREFLSYLTDQIEKENNGNTVYYQLMKYLIEIIKL